MFFVDTPEWLNSYAETELQRWDSIALAQPMDGSRRDKIRRNCASLLDLRNYLFLRQSTLLFLLLKPCEVAQRAVTFMLNTLQEIDILQASLHFTLSFRLDVASTVIFVPVAATRGRHCVLDVSNLY